MPIIPLIVSAISGLFGIGKQIAQSIVPIIWDLAKKLTWIGWLILSFIIFVATFGFFGEHIYMVVSQLNNIATYSLSIFLHYDTVFIIQKTIYFGIFFYAIRKIYNSVKIGNAG